AVGADAAVELPGLDREVERVDGHETAEPHRHVGELQERHARDPAQLSRGAGGTAGVRFFLVRNEANSRWPRIPCGRTIMMTMRRKEKTTMRYCENSRRPSVRKM